MIAATFESVGTFASRRGRRVTSVEAPSSTANSTI